MKDQVLSIEQMQELIELGIDVSCASMYYSGGSSSNKKLLPKTGHGKLHPGSIPTFTFLDIYDILPHLIFDVEGNDTYNLTIKKCGIYYRNTSNQDLIGFVFPMKDKEIMNSAFQMLKWCKENKYI